MEILKEGVEIVTGDVEVGATPISRDTHTCYLDFMDNLCNNAIWLAIEMSI